MAKSVMSSGQIIPFAPLLGENSSYTLTFEGPYFQCYNLSTVQMTSPLPHASNIKVPVYETGWLPLEGHAIFHVNRTVPVGYHPVTEEDRKCVGWNIEDGCGSDQISNATISIVLERHTLECKAYTTMYQVDIAYEKGIQHTAYSTGTREDLYFRAYEEFEWNITENGAVPNAAQAYKDWIALLSTWYHKANSMAIINSIGYNLNYRWFQQTGREYTGGGPDGKDVKFWMYKMLNGTEIELGEVTGETTNNADSKDERSLMNSY